jgi:hypothetical protein
MIVFLNVYDLPEQESRNEQLQNIGVGFYHTGVEVHFERGSMYEYSFSNMGISRTTPQLEAFGRLREQIRMGDVEDMSLQSLTETMNGIASSGGFSPGSYNVVHQNCNHFSDAACKALLNTGVPVWVNRAANMAAGFASKETTASNSSSSGGAGGGGGFAMPGKVKAPTLKKFGNATATAPAPAPAPSGGGGVFDWIWGSSSSSSTASASTLPTPPASQTVAAAVAKSHPALPKKADPGAPKALTEKQKAALAKMKDKGNK